MKYQTAQVFRTALEQRLKNEAEESGVALIRLRKRVAFERFLVRLAATEADGWALKGAFALELRLGLRTRTTKDIDSPAPTMRKRRPNTSTQPPPSISGISSALRPVGRPRSTPRRVSTRSATRFAPTSPVVASSSSRSMSHSVSGR